MFHKISKLICTLFLLIICSLIFACSSKEQPKTASLTKPVVANEGAVALVEKEKAGAASKKVLMYNSLEEINGKPVCILAGTIFDKTAKKYLPDSRCESYNTIADCLQALKSEKIDGFIIDEPVARGFKNANPDLGYFQIIPDLGSFALVVDKDNKSLQKVLNEGIQRYKKDGTLKKLDDIWFGSDDSIKQMPAPKEGVKGTVICGTTAEYYPIEYIKEGEIVGYEPALATSILQEAGYNVKFKNMDFKALIPSVVTHKIDVAMGCIVITEERQKSVFMTEPEYNDAVVIAVRAKNENGAQGTSIEKLWNDLKEGFNKNFIVENRYQMILTGLKTTVIISLGAVLLGTILGIIFCAMRRSSKKFLQMPIGIFVTVMQGTPMIVFLMIMYYIIFGKLSINPVFVAILAFALNFAAAESGVFSAGIDTVDNGQREASYAMGFTKTQTFIKIVLPQALKYIFPAFTGGFISMFKSTAIVGYIAIQDLTKMSDVIRSRTYEAFFPLLATALIYLVVAWTLASFLTYLQHRIDPKRRPRTLKGVQL